jgi:hypothetical protein
MRTKQTIAALLVAVALIGAMPFAAHAGDWGEGDTLDDALSELKVGFEDNRMDWLQLPEMGVIYLRYSYFNYRNERTGTIDEHPVYCIDPSKGGAYEIVHNVGPNPDDGSDTATYIRGEKVGDAKYRAILANGFPHQMFTSLGLQSREEGYYATKLALWMYIRGNDADTLTINPKYGSGDPAANRVRDAAISIFTKGTTITTGNYTPFLTLSGKPSATAQMDAAGEYFVQEVEVVASGWVGTNSAACGDVQLEWAAPPPAGTIVLGTNGEDITSTLAVQVAWQPAGYTGKATIKYPVAGLDKSYVPPTLKASAIVPNSEMYTAYAKADKDRFQRYLVEADPKIELKASLDTQLEWLPVGGDPDPDPEPTGTGVVIQKIDALTRKNIPGALVRLQGMPFCVLSVCAASNTRSLRASVTPSTSSAAGVVCVMVFSVAA